MHGFILTYSRAFHSYGFPTEGDYNIRVCSTPHAHGFMTESHHLFHAHTSRQAVSQKLDIGVVCFRPSLHKAVTDQLSASFVRLASHTATNVLSVGRYF